MIWMKSLFRYLTKGMSENDEFFLLLQNNYFARSSRHALLQHFGLLTNQTLLETILKTVKDFPLN